MTVASEINHNQYVGNGVTTAFDYGFRVFKNSHLLVQVSDLDGVLSTLALGTDYTVTGVGANGGKVVLTTPLASGWSISIDRNLPIVQETDLRNQGTFYAETHEDAFDYLTMLIQRVFSSFGLALKKPSWIAKYYDALGNRITNLDNPKLPSDAVNKSYADSVLSLSVNKTLRVPESFIGELPPAKDRAGKQFGFDVNGEAILLDPAGTGLLGYVTMDSFESGAVINQRFQVLRFLSNGEYYRWDGLLPKTVSSGSSPDSTGGIGVGKWISVGDATLRSDLKKNTGAGLIGTEKGGTIQNELNDLYQIVSGVKKNYSPCISFVFDDAKATHYSVVAPLFNSKNKSCGFAVNTVNINTPTNMLGSDIVELAGQGFEIINHAYTGVPFNSGVNDTFVKAELETAQSLFATMGLNPRIMQTPSSLAPASMQPVIRSMFEYAFTQASSATPMRNALPTELWRYGLESESGAAIPLTNAKSAVDAAKSSQGVVIFYAHDVPAGSDKYQLISDIIDYATAVGVKVLPPSLAVASATCAPNIPNKSYIKGDTLMNSTDLWTANNGTIAVSANGDITVTATAAGTCLIQRSTTLQLKNDETINFSAAIRNITGSVSAASIGMNTSTDATVVKRAEYSIVGLDSQYRRYSVCQQIGVDVNTMLQYVRVTFSAAGDKVLIRLPTVRYGANVLQDANLKSFYSVGIATGQTIPNSASSYTTISLTSAANNGLFTVSGNTIVFSRPCKLMLSVSILSNSSALSGNTGGLLRIAVASDAINIPSSSGSGIAGASHSMTVSVEPRGTLSFSMLNTGSTFGIYSASTIRIQEL